MTLLVLDANALRRGHFSVSGLRQWIDAVGEGAEIVIPEVVIWEWAEHAASAHTTLQSQLREFRVDPGLCERPALAELASIESLVEGIRGLLPRSIRIWSAPNAVLKQAIMEQVLQIGSGERKEGIKTGAADSVVLACVQEQVDGRRNAEPVLLATNDTRLKANCSRLFPEEVVLAGSTVALLERLNAFVPAEQELLEATQEALSGLLTDRNSGIGGALDTFDMGFRIHVGMRATERPHRDVPFRDLARLGRIDIVELHDLRFADQSNKPRVGLADVRVFADVHMTELQLRDTAAGTSEWVTTFDSLITHGFIDLTVAIAWDTHWKVQTVSPTGAAVIVFDSSDYDDLDDVPPFHAGPVAL